MTKRYVSLLARLAIVGAVLWIVPPLGASKAEAQAFAVLHGFSGIDGFNPASRLVEGSDGALYGTTYAGGVNGVGVVFRVNKDGTGFEKLHDFNLADAANGANPYAGLVEASDGTFYGTTYNGGPNNGGVNFRLTLGCEASVQVQDDVHVPGSAVTVQVHIAHRRPKTVTVPWELRLLDASGQVIAKDTTAPLTFEPGDVVDREVEFRLPNDLASGTYTLELAISGMAGTKGATTTFPVVRASNLAER